MQSMIKYVEQFTSEGCEILLVFMFGCFIYAIVDYIWVFIIHILHLFIVYVFLILFFNFIEKYNLVKNFIVSAA